MLREPTREKLLELRLDAFEKAWAQQQQDPEIDRLGFDEKTTFGVMSNFPP